MSLKTTYLGEKGENKRKVRDFLFSKMPKYNKVIGLAGPDVEECINNYINKGFTSIQIFENDKSTLLLQLSKIKKQPFLLIFGDILMATANLTNTIYDLDYCVTIKHMEEHIYKFMNSPCFMTFSLRCFTTEGDLVIKEFVKFRKEIIVSISSHLEQDLCYKIINTNKSKYIYITYTDTSRMCCFAKI